MGSCAGKRPNPKRGLRVTYSSTIRRSSGVLILIACSGALSLAQDTRPKAASTTREAGLAAWQQVYAVLTYPRCINCHTATNYPQQGDDRHPHLFNVVRGPEGTGVAGLNCATCHQSANADTTGVPGAHNWHLAPLSMTWQDLNDNILSSPDVCRSLTDRSKNGSLDGSGILRHHEEEPLVLWAFQPGRRRDGTERSLPPLTHEQFVTATRAWVEAGTPCPQNP